MKCDACGYEPLPPFKLIEFDAVFDRFRELFTKGRNSGLTELERVELRSIAHVIKTNMDEISQDAYDNLG